MKFINMLHGEEIPRYSTILLAKRNDHPEPINLIAAFPPNGKIKLFDQFWDLVDDPDIFTIKSDIKRIDEK